jgi:hypothetical protein
MKPLRKTDLTLLSANASQMKIIATIDTDFRILVLMLMIKYLILRTLQLETYAHCNCHNSKYRRL